MKFFFFEECPTYEQYVTKMVELMREHGRIQGRSFDGQCFCLIGASNQVLYNWYDEDRPAIQKDWRLEESRNMVAMTFNNRIAQKAHEWAKAHDRQGQVVTGYQLNDALDDDEEFYAIVLSTIDN